MTKKLICLAMAAMMIFTGCRGAEAPAESAPASTPASSTGEAPAESAPAATENFKIGIITGTASQGDEEITQANKMI